MSKSQDKSEILPKSGWVVESPYYITLYASLVIYIHTCSICSNVVVSFFTGHLDAGSPVGGEPSLAIWCGWRSL